ncbi:hypothetical protein QBC40DRAFT_342250 [Triangularia verruculosa]|uniref:Uncharacterized protein n=1 Tax=Triangularia verruculosa TaxID=2587418 RepID=A0AAN6XAM9_9PEZI|nr:hypothetical protein QBC40DRAFT_342250 [Triangularia verruculosa]
MSTGTLAPLPSNTTSSSKTYHLDDIENLFTTLRSHPGVQDIADIVDENKKLRAGYSDLECDNEHTLNQVARLQTSLDAARKESKDVLTRLQAALKEKQTLNSQYSEVQRKLSDNEKNLGEERSKMEQQIEAVKQELNHERAELQRLSAFSTNLVPITENYKQISSIMDSIRTSALKLAETYLCDDIPLNGVNWALIKNHTALGGADRIFPLPVSNSSIAKHMRVAAFLAILGHEMRNHLFQPVYLLRNSSELNSFLDHLAEENEEAEAHLRSVLLRAVAELKPLSDSVSAECVQTVINNVASCVKSLVLEAKRQPFESELKVYCAKARQEWGYIQKLERRVEFEISPDDGDLKDRKCWLQLTTKASSSPMISPSRGHANGGTKNASSGPKRDKGGASAGAVSPPQSPIEVASFLDVVVVWPAATAERKDDTAILSLGYFLTASEIATAMMEQKEQTTSKDQHRAVRDSRRRSRAMSTAGHSSGENGSTASRSGSFLSAQLGNGPKES